MSSTRQLAEVFMRSLFLLGVILPLHLALSQTVLIPGNPHQWPLSSRTGPHTVSGTVGEFRSGSPGHFHGGVDMPRTAGDSVYAVMWDYDYVVEATAATVTDGRLVIRRWFSIGGSGTGWNQANDGVGDNWFTHRYLHITAHSEDHRRLRAQDKIVNNSTLTRRTYNTSTGFWEYPQHLSIAKIGNITPSHIHFEEVCYDSVQNNGVTPGFFIFNPLNFIEFLPGSWSALLMNFSDSDIPVVTEDSLYPNGSSTPITTGSGTQTDPYRISQSITQLDVRNLTYDRVGTRDDGVYAIAWRLFTEQGDTVPGLSGVYIFWVLGPVPTTYLPFPIPEPDVTMSRFPGDVGTRVVGQGFTWIYHPSSTQTPHRPRYWATNKFNAFQGGADGYINIASLPLLTNYRIRVRIFDSRADYSPPNSFAERNIWIRREPPTSVYQLPGDLPGDFHLAANFPNPFNPSTVIRYQLPVNSYVSLKVYDLLGREIRTLTHGEQPAGYYEATWDGKDGSGKQVSSGLYFYRIAAGEFTDRKTMVLMK